MFNEIFSGEAMPQEWNFAYICPTYKEGDDKFTGNSDRCISVINSIGRVFIGIIKNKTENMMKKRYQRNKWNLQKGSLVQIV